MRAVLLCTCLECILLQFVCHFLYCCAMDKFVIRKRKAEKEEQDTAEDKHANTAQQQETFSSVAEALRIPTETLKEGPQWASHFAKVADFLLNRVVLVANNKLVGISASDTTIDDTDLLN